MSRVPSVQSCLEIFLLSSDIERLQLRVAGPNAWASPANPKDGFSQCPASSTGKLNSTLIRCKSLFPLASLLSKVAECTASLWFSLFLGALLSTTPGRLLAQSPAPPPASAEITERVRLTVEREFGFRFNIDTLKLFEEMTKRKADLDLTNEEEPEKKYKKDSIVMIGFIIDGIIDFSDIDARTKYFPDIQ